MSAFAIFVVLLVIVAAALGWMAGFVKQMGKFAGLIVAIIGCRIFGPLFVSAIGGDSLSATQTILYTILVYVVLFVAIYIGVLLIARVLKGILGKVHLGGLDRLAGALFKVCLWLMMLSLALNLFVAIVPDTALLQDGVFNRVVWFAPFLLGAN